MAGPLSLYDAHFIPLPSQGNIYSLASVRVECGVTKVIVASLKRKVYSLEYERHTDGSLNPKIKEITFTYLPAGSEIISIDAFNKSQNPKELVVGIAIIKEVERQGGGGTRQYLNIYSDWESYYGASPLEVLAQNWRHMELDFIPYQLTHAVTDVNGITDTVFLLSGSDRRIHLYCEDKPNQSFCERPIEALFPEFSDLPSIVLCIDFYWSLPGRRVTAVACECGYVRVSVVRLRTVLVEHTWTVEIDSPVSAVRLFSTHTALPPPPSILPPPPSILPPAPAPSATRVHLLVCGTLAPTVVYTALPLCPSDAPALYRPLPGTAVGDVITCCCVCDINMDAVNELLLGSYGQELLVYSLSGDEWRLVWQHSFSQPLLAVTYVDLIGDGINELVVLTNHGLNVLQHDTDEAADLVCRRLDALDLNMKGQLSQTSETAGSHNSCTAAYIPQNSCTASDVPQNSCTAADIPQNSYTAADVPQNSCIAADVPRNSFTASDVPQNSCTAAGIPQNSCTATEVLQNSCKSADLQHNSCAAAEADTESPADDSSDSLSQ